MKTPGIPAQPDATLQAYRQETRQKLLQHPVVVRFLQQHGLGPDFVEQNSGTLQAWLERLNRCAGCKGAQMCRQPIRGKVCTLDMDETGYLIETYVSCKYEQAEEKKRDHAKNFVYNYGDPDDYLIDLGETGRVAQKQKDARYLNAFVRANQSRQEERGIYLYGQPGVGKTYLLHALANQYAKEDVKVAFVNVPAFIQNMKESMTQNDYRASVMNRLRKVPVLFLDDIGSEFISQWTRSELLFPLLDERMNTRRKTYFSSNYTLEELEKQYVFEREKNSKVSALRLIERIRALSDPVALTGESRRQKVSG